MAEMTLGRLARTYAEAIKLLDAQKAAGVSFADRMRGLEAVLREVWPKTRVWHYLCSNCDDHGLAMAVCPGDPTCGRTFPHQPHDYGTPCWCEKGVQFRDKPKPTSEDFSGAGKSKPMSRMGRR